MIYLAQAILILAAIAGVVYNMAGRGVNYEDRYWIDFKFICYKLRVKDVTDQVGFCPAYMDDEIFDETFNEGDYGR